MTEFEEATDYDWQPPTEAEMKIIQARKERSDKISSIMGEYLLKGYKMLSVVCDICETILLETPTGEKYCIACKELDEDAEKDNPVFQTQILPQQSQSDRERRERSDAACKLMGDYLLKGYKMLGSTCDKCDTVLLQDRSKNDFCVTCQIIDQTKGNGPDMLPAMEQPPVLRPVTDLSPSKSYKIPANSPNTFDNTKDVLRHKIDWATDQLKQSTCVDMNIQLCNLIKSAAEALSAVQSVGLYR